MTPAAHRKCASASGSCNMAEGKRSRSMAAKEYLLDPYVSMPTLRRKLRLRPSRATCNRAAPCSSQSCRSRCPPRSPLEAATGGATPRWAHRATPLTFSTMVRPDDTHTVCVPTISMQVAVELLLRTSRSCHLLLRAHSLSPTPWTPKHTARPCRNFTPPSPPVRLCHTSALQVNNSVLSSHWSTTAHCFFFKKATSPIEIRFCHAEAQEGANNMEGDFS